VAWRHCYGFVVRPDRKRHACPLRRDQGLHTHPPIGSDRCLETVGYHVAMHRRDFIASTIGALAAAYAGACGGRNARHSPPWDGILPRMPRRLADLIDAQAHEVQVIYTRIDRAGDQRPALTTAELGIAPARWFTAASWVKLPAALLTAELLTRDGLDETARIVLDAPPASGNWDPAEPLDESFARTVRRLFTVSENVPFNRLYELLGQGEIGTQLSAHGLPDARVIARLGSADAEANRHVGSTRILAADGREIERRPARTNDTAPSFPYGQVLRGRGWQTDEGVMIPGPHDFTRTNFIPLRSMHQMLAALIYPDATPAASHWNISPRLRHMILTELARWPRESADPLYAPPEYFDGFTKYFVVGDTRSAASADVRHFSKSGQAYGYLQDCACIVDRHAGVEFLLSATIHANADGIFNDDKYEYEEIALPFLASLGRAVLDCERERPRAVRPTFNEFPSAW
jgi:hypothetical protein